MGASNWKTCKDSSKVCPRIEGLGLLGRIDRKQLLEVKYLDYRNESQSDERHMIMEVRRTMMSDRFRTNDDEVIVDAEL